jgi:hypothetical protein
MGVIARPLAVQLFVPPSSLFRVAEDCRVVAFNFFTMTCEVREGRVELLFRQDQMLLDELPVTAVLEMIENEVDSSSPASDTRPPAKSDHTTLAQSPSGAEAPGSAYEGD